jgi:membrane protease subunit HflC
MTSSRLPTILIALAVILLLVYSSVFVVNAREQAIVLRFGQIRAVKTEPGLYFKLPFAFMDADRVQYIQLQELRFDLDNIRVQVSGGKFYEVDAFVVYKITDARKFRETVSGDRDAAEIAPEKPASTPRCVVSTVCATSKRLYPTNARR